MNETVVTTKEELKKAKDKKVEIILVEGELAKNLRRSKKIGIATGGLSVVAVAALAASLAAAPVSGGASLAGFAAVAPTAAAAFSGFEISAIIAASAIGLTLLIAIFKDYEEVEAGPNGGIKLKRKQRKT
ncbi:hypothetical protein ABU178_08420 [Pantoea osteomyelitidis]|uniref:Uncharacterized protein n=1 Tax=Pantoea osteomyelitidis TaxID=3230026 RepID=A0ABW7PVE3_9GAMM